MSSAPQSMHFICGFDAWFHLEMCCERCMIDTRCFEVNLIQALHINTGCYMSHLGVYKLIASGDRQFGIIFEDDVNIDPHIIQKLNQTIPTIPSNWDILLMGCWCAVCDPHDTYYESKKFYFLHAYIVKKSGAVKIIDLIDKKKISQQIDSQLSDLAGDGKIDIMCLKDSISSQSVMFPTTIQVPMKQIDGVNAFARPS